MAKGEISSILLAYKSKYSKFVNSDNGCKSEILFLINDNLVNLFNLAIGDKSLISFSFKSSFSKLTAFSNPSKFLIPCVWINLNSGVSFKDVVVSIFFPSSSLKLSSFRDSSSFLVIFWSSALLLLKFLLINFFRIGS